MEIYFDVEERTDLFSSKVLIPHIVHNNQAIKIGKPIKTLGEAFSFKEGFDLGTYIRDGEGFEMVYEKTVTAQEKKEDE